MHRRNIPCLLLSVCAIVCLAASVARAQPYPPVPPPPGPAYDDADRPPPPPPGGTVYEERERRVYREGGDPAQREHERRERDWREHQRRFFGGIVIQVDPFANEKEYRRQLHARCNAAWQSCANGCNAFPDPPHQNACMNSCNNNLYECQEMP